MHAGLIFVVSAVAPLGLIQGGCAARAQPVPAPYSYAWVDSSASSRSYDDLKNDPLYREALATFTGPAAASALEAWQYRIGLFTLMVEMAGASDPDSIRQHYARAANLAAWQTLWILAPPGERKAHFAAATLPDSLGRGDQRDLSVIHRATCDDPPFLDCSFPISLTHASGPTDTTKNSDP